MHRFATFAQHPIRSGHARIATTLGRSIAGSLIAAIILPGTLAAQATDASVHGSVVASDSMPVAGANVILRNESTGFQSATLAGPTGDFAFSQLPLGGPYSVSVSMLGYREASEVGVQLSQGERVEVRFELVTEALALEGIEVVGTVAGFRSRDRRLSSSTSIDQSDLRTLPAADRTFSNLQQLSPLIGSGGNIFGQQSRNNSILIDGVNAREAAFGGSGDSPYKLSMEALREFEVVTNSYDVTDGRGAFGGIRAVTRSGTNRLEGSIFAYHQDERLAARQDLLGRDVAGQTKSQRGFSLGGPIIRDKLHFFVAYDGERFAEQFDMWSQSTDDTYYQSNEGERVSREDMDRLLAAVPQYGIDPEQQQIGFFQRDVTLDTYFGRLDWQIDNRHRLTVRSFSDSYSRPNMNNSDIGRYGTMSAAYDFTNSGNNTLAHLRSQLSPTTLNELRIGYFSNDRGNRITTGRHPQLWVLAQSEVNGELENFTFMPRYNRWTPETQIARTLSLTNNTHLRWGGNDVVIGTENTYTRSEGIYTHDTQGRFDFFSIEAFENMQPDRYRRKHTNPGQELVDPVDAGLAELSAYAQLTRELVPDLEATFGLRYDVAIFTTPADYNPVLEEELGYRNDVNPVDFTNIQPRLNLHWDLGGRGRDIVNAGVGLFMGQTVTRPYIYSMIDNGIRFTEVDVSRGDMDGNGASIPLPTPDYTSYDSDYSSIPGDGLTDQDLGRGSDAQVIRFLDEDLKMPRAFRAHASYHRYLTDWLRVGGSAYFAHVSRLHVMENVNLPDQVQFTVEGEGGREVYVPVSQVAPQAVARKSEQFADALMYTNGNSARSTSLVLDATAALTGGSSISASYTFNEARGGDRFRNEDDQRFVGASYFDDYSFINDAYSENDFRHKLLLNVTSPTVGGWQLGTLINLRQQGRFSALVGRYDLSGTRIREEVGYAAFVFDPDDPGTRDVQGDQFVEDMRFVLDNAHPNAAEYLRDNFGEYATAYGGINPWSASVDLRLTNEIQLLGSHRILLHVDAFNLLNLISDSRGGNDNIINTASLYDVESFDPETQTFQYRVNRDFGQSRYEGSGFNLALGAKYIF
ncbi:MAG: TonB-dependent receptor plug domain-containing protein [Gemmatimonas sp.]|nr:TonB-dependent receptor plug domain-containing protein [Gemmatimonas sp.]